MSEMTQPEEVTQIMEQLFTPKPTLDNDVKEFQQLFDSIEREHTEPAQAVESPYAKQKRLAAEFEELVQDKFTPPSTGLFY